MKNRLVTSGQWAVGSYPALIMFAVMILFLPPAQAEEEKSNITFLSQKEITPHKKTINRVAKYISGLSTIVADFTQVAPDGSLTSGKFFLARPGKMRWQYNAPTPVLMIANGIQFVYYDYELEQVTYLPLDSALVGFLAQKEVNFDDKVGIIGFEKRNSVIRITIAQKDNPDEGQLTLEFSDKPLLIRNMIVTDSSKQTTQVALSNAKFGLKLDKSLFIFTDPRKGLRKSRGGTVLNR